MTKRKGVLIVLGVLALVAAGVAATLAIGDAEEDVQAEADQAADAENDPGQQPLTDSVEDEATDADSDTATEGSEDSTGADGQDVPPAPEDFDEPEPESADPEILAAPGDEPGWQPVLDCVNGLIIQSDGTDWRIEELGMAPQPLEDGEVPRRALVELCGAVPTEEDLAAQAEAAESLAYELTLLGPITFAPGTTDLVGESATVLDTVAELLRNQPGALIEVAGHADSRGSAADNLLLSEERAATIVTELEQRGVLNELVPIGRGEEALRQLNEDDAIALAQNRRIELRVIL